jgi:hypothetical protein
VKRELISSFATPLCSGTLVLFFVRAVDFSTFTHHQLAPLSSRTTPNKEDGRIRE